MNGIVVDPHWGAWIVWYFFLGGTAAGAYFLATLAELWGGASQRHATRAGYLIAAPLIGLCGIFLILDLNQPTRFWHMLLNHDTWLPHMKFWSPMSIGAWAVLLFSLVSTLSFLGSLAEFGWFGLGRFSRQAVRLHHGIWGHAFDVTGAACGFFVASYTGVLLTATNQPVWSDSPWIGALFLASSAGTGLAAIRLISPLLPRAELDPTSAIDAGHTSSGANSLDRIETGCWLLELTVAILFWMSLPEGLRHALWQENFGIFFFVGALGCGIAVPALLRFVWRAGPAPRHTLACCCILAGGFLLRYSLLVSPELGSRKSVVAIQDSISSQVSSPTVPNDEAEVLSP